MSQHGQDRHVVRTLLPGVIGVFVDVGAFDGITLSNTVHLERNGWSGLAIEAHPDSFSRLVANRSCAIERLAIAEHAGSVGFRAINGETEMLSGISQHYDARHRARIEAEIEQDGGHFTEIEVACSSLTDVLVAHCIDHVDYLTIDVEGGELAVLRGIDFSRFTFSVIGVENNYQDPRIPRFLKDRGFRVHSVVGDEFYVPDSLQT